MYGKVDYYYRREKINMKRLSEDLSAWLVKQGVITIEDIELYEYAVYSFFSFSSSLLFSESIGPIKQIITPVIITSRFM